MTTSPPDRTAASVVPDDAQPAAPEAPAAPPSRYSMGSASNLVRSLLVIVGLVAVLIAIVPRVNQVDQPAVDAAAVVGDAVTQSGLPLELPVGLPAGWKATSARYAKSTDGVLTWQAGYTTPKDGFVAIRQASGVTPNWIAVATNQGEVTGSVTAGGRTWEKRYAAAHDQTSLVDEHDGGLTTVIAATASSAEIQVFADALKVAPASP